jgi:hypothetical protein
LLGLGNATDHDRTWHGLAASEIQHTARAEIDEWQYDEQAPKEPVRQCCGYAQDWRRIAPRLLHGFATNALTG